MISWYTTIAKQTETQKVCCGRTRYQAEEYLFCLAPPSYAWPWLLLVLTTSAVEVRWRCRRFRVDEGWLVAALRVTSSELVEDVYEHDEDPSPLPKYNPVKVILKWLPKPYNPNQASRAGKKAADTHRDTRTSLFLLVLSDKPALCLASSATHNADIQSELQASGNSVEGSFRALEASGQMVEKSRQTRSVMGFARHRDNMGILTKYKPNRNLLIGSKVQPIVGILEKLFYTRH